MATQTCFDLNAALENWRNELNAQPQLTPDNRRELEKHLADSMAELRQRGLNGEESFWLAQRRMGQPQRLAEEFEKADPARIWRERVFWMVWAFLFFLLWTSLASMISAMIPSPTWWIWWMVNESLAYLPLICLAILLARGKLNINRYLSGSFFKDRRLFAGSAIIFLLLTRGVQTWERYLAQNEAALRLSTLKHHPPLQEFWSNEIQALALPLMIIAVASWLLPVQKQSIKNSVLT